MKYLVALLLLLCSCATPERLKAFQVDGYGGSGTGCLVSEHQILTCRHVVDDSGDFRVWGVPAEGVRKSKVSDLATLTTEYALSFPVLTLADLDPDEPVNVHTRYTIKHATVHGPMLIFEGEGIIPGDSGSPMIQNGHLVGVVWGSWSDPEGAGTWVPIQRVREFLK